MSIIRNARYFFRLELLFFKYKFDSKNLWQKGAIVGAISAATFGLIWIPVAFWLSWRIYKLAPRWVALSLLVFYVLISGPMLADWGGSLAGHGVFFIVVWAICWVYWFHTVTFRQMRGGSGQKLGLRVKGRLVLPLAYPVLRLRKRFRRQARALRHVDNALFDLFVHLGWWGHGSPARAYSVEQAGPDNYRLNIAVPRGMTDEQFLAQAPPRIAAELNLVRIIPLPIDPRGGIHTFALCVTDPLVDDLDSREAHVLNLTKVERENTFLWLKVGVDAVGADFGLPMFLEVGGAIRQLVAGESGAGKSSIVNQQLLQACMNPLIDVVCTDGKGPEFHHYENYCLSYVSLPRDGVKAILGQVDYLLSEVRRRALVLAQNKATQSERFSDAWNPYDDGPMLLWVLDEMGAIKASMDKKAFDDFHKLCYGILSVARSLGIGAIWSGQSWKAEFLPTETRNNCFDVSVGFKLNSVQESMYINFDSAAEVRPDKIFGELLETGRHSSVGQFAIRGLKETYGKSYYITPAQIKAALSTVEPVNPTFHPSEPITTVESVASAEPVPLPESEATSQRLDPLDAELQKFWEEEQGGDS